MYASASFNDKMLGHREPVRVREDLQRVARSRSISSPTIRADAAPLSPFRITRTKASWVW